MEKEEIISLVSLFNMLRSYGPKLDKAVKDKDAETLASLKKEILAISKSAERIL